MKKRAQDVAAKIIRVASIPPVMVTILIAILSVYRNDVFATWQEAAMAVLFLAILPAMAYPVCAAVPKLKAMGREGQRNTAFIFSFISYLLGWIYGALCHVGQYSVLIYTIYLFSVLLLLLLNKVFHLRASGHGCSVTGPIVLIGYFFGIWGAFAGAAAFLAILWASIRIKRHTVAEFMLGAATCVAAAMAAWALCIGIK